jgi:hypothetical protein
MANTILGGKSAPPKKRGLPELLMMGTKKDAAPANTPEAPEPDDAGKGPDGKTIQPGESQFHDQTQTCATCEHFDATDGVGVCKMGVPEADFSVSDPDASWCKYFEGQDDATETPDQEAAENEDNGDEAGPAGATPGVA